MLAILAGGQMLLVPGWSNDRTVVPAGEGREYMPYSVQEEGPAQSV